MELEKARSSTSSFEMRVKTLCSIYGCALRVITATNSDSAGIDCITILLLDILSAIQDMAQSDSVADSRVAWSAVVKQLTDAKSEVEHCQSCDLSAVTKKLVQMQEIL